MHLPSNNLDPGLRIAGVTDKGMIDTFRNNVPFLSFPKSLIGNLKVFALKLFRFLIKTFRNDRQEDTLTLTLSLQGRGKKDVKLSLQGRGEKEIIRGLLFSSFPRSLIENPNAFILNNIDS